MVNVSCKNEAKDLEPTKTNKNSESVHVWVNFEKKREAQTFTI